MAETQKVLFGVGIASLAVIYNTMKSDSIGKIELISAGVTLMIIASVGYWLYSNAKRTSEPTNTSLYQEAEKGLEFIYNTGQGTLDHKNKLIKEAHHQLVDLIVYGGDKSAFHELIDKHDIPKRGEAAYQNRNRHFSYFYLLNEAYTEFSHHLLINLDWKEGVSDFRWHLGEALKGTEYKPRFPSDDKYPANASILYGLAFNDPNSLLSTVYEDYIRALNDVGLGLAFFETYADYFVVIMYKVEDRKAIESKVSHTGLFFGSTK